MAARTRKPPIRLEALLEQLQAHALGRIELSATQLRAIDLLIKKVGTSHGPEEGDGRVIRVIFERKIVAPDGGDDQGRP